MKNGNNEELSVLTIDDDIISLKFYRTVLESYNIKNIIEFNDSSKVIPFCENNEPMLVLLDLNMPNISGIELLKKINEMYPDLPVIVITGESNVDMAVECMKNGAFDYLVKPVKNERLYSVVKHALEIQSLKKEVNQLSRKVLTGQLKDPEAFGSFITQNEKIQSIFKYIEVIANTPKAVLITGESGTGKELIARIIHKLSSPKGNFVAVNVAGLDENVFSDTLFGHKKGAYTGAESDRKGLIEQAKDGILFLDEIGDLDHNSQVKLLRLLQEKEYYPLGSDTPQKSNANIVAATNADLKKLIEKGKFRNDLYYRLISHHIHITPLRERQEDIPLLIDHFLDEASKNLKKDKPAVPKELYILLSNYYYPGNVRELQSMLYESLSLHSSGIMSLNFFKKYLKENNKGGAENISLSEKNQDETKRIIYNGVFPTLKEVEDFFITEALKKAKGNQSIAANMLGVNQSTLSRRLKDKES